MTTAAGNVRGLLTVKPPRIALALLAGAGALKIALPTAAAGLPSSLLAGIAAGIFGFGIMLRAWWLFRENETAICPTATTTALIKQDVYRLTRNPMYLGMVSMLLGVAIALGSWPFYGAAILYLLILDRVFCSYEERKLLQQYGIEYAHYMTRVRRWL